MYTLSQIYRQILNINNWRSRKFIEKVLLLLEKEWNEKDIFIIEAPTGYGKSTISQTIALYSLNRELKCIIAFPLRTLLEDQYCKFVNEYQDKNGKDFCKGERGIFSRINPELRRKIVGKRYMHNMDSRYLTKPVTLTTIDTLSLTLFGIPPEDLGKVVRKWSGTSSGSLGHYLFSQSSVLFSNIVLDEVHLLSDSIKSLSFLVLLLKFAMDNGQKLILMSATIPSALEEKMLDFIGADDIEIVRFDSKKKDFYDEQFVEERKKKKYKIFLHKIRRDEKYSRILSCIENERLKKRIIIFNTVEDSANFFNMIKDKRLIENKILLHSRFNEIDRGKKTEKLKEFKNRNEYLIISTQTIEAGIDISSNLFITEIAPANSLIQRLGRFLRYEGENEGEVHIWYEVDENGSLKRNKKNKYKVYDWELTNRTIDFLKNISFSFEEDNTWGFTSEKLNFHVPEYYQNLLNSVYMAEDFKIDRDNIEDFFSILLNVEKLSKKSLEKFIELEGSFVRDEMLVPIITCDIIDKIVNDQEKTELTPEQINCITKHIIPISITKISELGPKKYLVTRRGEELGKEMLEKKTIPDDVIKNAEKLFKFMLKKSVMALIVDRKYDEELGLLIEEGKDE